MTTYAYISLDPSGRRKSGFIDAMTREAAAAAIAAEGRFVLELKEQSGRTVGTATGTTEKRRGGGVSRADLALFTRRLSDLSDAGLPLDRVLQVVGEQSESGTLAGVAEEALQEVRAGRPVSDSLAMHPRLFPAVYTQTLRAGEASGQFPQVAARLADFQEKEVARRSQIVSALIYPIILFCTAVFVIIFLLTFVVPKLSKIFTSLGNDLPLPTQILLAVTDFLTHRGVYLLAGIAVIIFGYRAWTRTEQGALIRDGFFLNAPLFGKIVQKATVSRFSRVLGTLVYGGVPILEAINLAGLAAGNRVFLRSATQVEQEVREGRPIAGAMRDAGAFPPVLIHMVAIGEETGDLPKMLGRVSDSLDFEVDNGMRRLTALVEPIIVLGMGTFVGFVVLSVLLPIYAAQDLVK
jgi:type II secretory pathway component PulF